MDWSILWKILLIVNESLVAWAVLSVIRRPREPRAMWAWILALLLIPVVGLVAFFLIGEPRIRRTRARRRKRRMRILQSMRQHVGEVRTGSRQKIAYSQEPSIHAFMRLAARIGGRPPTRGNSVVVHHESTEMFDDLSDAIRAARSHVHMEYYIFQADATGRMIRDLLIDKAKRGIKCRLLLDFVGCWKMFDRFIRPMRDAGVEVVFFMPVLPWRRRTRVNFRNHRKIAIIDGVVAFTGSQNIGDEYAGRKRGLQWRDTNIRITGPAVHHLQEIFIEDWFFACRRDITLMPENYFPPSLSTEDHVVQIVPSGPDRETNVLHHLLLGAIGTAREKLRLATPYFVPDAALILALQSAAHRGVCVELLIPSKTDYNIVLWAGRSSYRELRQAGVEIYEYEQGMLHSKVLVVDDRCALVGSANFDERSLRLNFEVSTLLYEPQMAGLLLADFAALRSQARRVLLHKKVGFIESLKLGLARLISPLL